jgi:hypothetical protein
MFSGTKMPLPAPSSVTLVATASIFAALFIRRRVRIRAALSAWFSIAAARGLPNAPPHFVRVAISGLVLGILVSPSPNYLLQACLAALVNLVSSYYLGGLYPHVLLYFSSRESEYLL